MPRLGSACPNPGIAPWARREGPSMAQRGYLGIHAEVPTAQYLRSASVVNGASRSRSRSRSRSKAKQERGTSSNYVAEPPLSRASSLPHGGCGCSQHLHTTQKTCGSELARDGVGTANITTNCPSAFASKPAPTWGCGCSQHLHTTQKTVGAGLLAMASAQPTSPQTAPPLSRASSLPHLSLIHI